MRKRECVYLFHHVWREVSLYMYDQNPTMEERIVDFRYGSSRIDICFFFFRLELIFGNKTRSVHLYLLLTREASQIPSHFQPICFHYFRPFLSHFRNLVKRMRISTFHERDLKPCCKISSLLAIYRVTGANS
jgi:hypothetical protein